MLNLEEFSDCLLLLEKLIVQNLNPGLELNIFLLKSVGRNSLIHDIIVESLAFLLVALWLEFVVRHVKSLRDVYRD